MKLPAGLHPWRNEKRWVLWRLERKGDQKPTKVPYQGAAPRALASTTSPDTWCNWETVCAVWDQASGGGFVLTGSKWIVIDLDDVRDPETGLILPWALDIIIKAKKLGAYIEISVLGQGIHIIGMGNGAEPRQKMIRFGKGKVELYRAVTRYITVSGLVLDPANEGSCGADIDSLVDGIDAMKGLARRVESGRGEDRSARSAAICFRLFEQGLSADEVKEHLRKKPEGTKTEEFSGRTTSWGLEADVDSLYRKWLAKKGEVVEVAWAKGKMPRPGLPDAIRAINALGVQVRFDVFHGRYLIAGFEGVRELDDAASLRIRRAIVDQFGFDPKKTAVDDALMSIGQENRFDPVVEYLDQLRWDGVRRLDRWLIRYMGCSNTPAIRAIGALVLIAGVRRVRQPGCKFDQIIVLEGPEGKGKSQAIRILARDGDNFSDQSILGLSDERQQERLSGVWMYEVADLKGLKYAEVDAVKALLSRQEDRARPAYGRFVQHQKRTVILWATTNEIQYLKGTTGNRRWWTLKVGGIDLDRLEDDCDQLWAEAVVRERNWPGELVLGEEHWPALQVMQRGREEYDPWEDKLKVVRGKTYPRRDDDAGLEERVSNDHLMGAVLGIKTADRYPGTYRRVMTLMSKLGWTSERLRIDGNICRGYARAVNVAKNGNVLRIHFRSGRTYEIPDDDS